MHDGSHAIIEKNNMRYHQTLEQLEGPAVQCAA
jgi:hypothetical protein